MNAFQNNLYTRERAVEYALKFAMSPNLEYKYFEKGGGDCSNFISQCLKAGGAPMDFGSSIPWWYGRNGSNKNGNACSLSWSVAHSLYWCLKRRGTSNLRGLKGIEVTDIKQLQLGDIIQYERGGRIYHSAIITSFIVKEDNLEPLISQHTYNAMNVTYFKPKAEKMHFMKIIVA